MIMSATIHAVSSLFRFSYGTVPVMEGSSILWVQPFPVWTFVIEIVLTLLLLAAVFLFKARILKVLSACAAEFCLWQAVKVAFGADAILTQIMTWITAAMAVVITLVVVNMIPWKPYGSEKSNDSPSDKPQQQ